MKAFKIIIIGSSGVGKSAIVQKLVSGTFRSEINPTIGIEFKSYVCNINGEQTKLQIWDTAGQERFRSLSKSYFRNAVGAILVFDISNSNTFEELSFWWNDLYSLIVPNAAVLLVGNKSDIAHRQVGQEEAADLAKEHHLDYIETSALSGDNITETFLRLATEISNRIKSGNLILPSYSASTPTRLRSDNEMSEATTQNEKQNCQC